MKANFRQILHQSAAPTNNTPPPVLSNSDQLPKISFLKKIIQSIYKSRSKAIKFSAPPTGSVLKEKSLSGSTPNQISDSRHQTKSNENQPRVTLSQHLTSLSPYKKEVHHNRKNSTGNSRQPKSISKIRFDHDLTPLTNNKAKLRKTYEKVNPAIKNSNFSDDELLAKNGATIPPVNQAAAMVLKNSDTTLSWPRDNFSIYQSIIHSLIYVKLTITPAIAHPPTATQLQAGAGGWIIKMEPEKTI